MYGKHSVKSNETKQRKNVLLRKAHKKLYCYFLKKGEVYD